MIADQEFESDAEFRTFHCYLFHSSLTAALETMHPAMLKPEVTLCADGHYQRAIYSIGPYIADYPEQALLACIVQGWCPKWVMHLNYLHCSSTNIVLDALHIIKIWIAKRMLVHIITNTLDS